jgi:hypothetical protein
MEDNDIVHQSEYTIDQIILTKVFVNNQLMRKRVRTFPKQDRIACHRTMSRFLPYCLVTRCFETKAYQAIKVI